MMKSEKLLSLAARIVANHLLPPIAIVSWGVVAAFFLSTPVSFLIVAFAGLVYYQARYKTEIFCACGHPAARHRHGGKCGYYACECEKMRAD